MEEGQKKKGFVEESWAFLKTLALFILIAWLIRVIIIEPYKIPSSSMVPTLEVGDHILVSKLSYGLRLPFMDETAYRWDTPKAGDIVVFTRPDVPSTRENESNTNIIKRVIGVGGDTIEVRGPRLYRNGNVVEESYARWADGGIKEGDFGPVKVPEDHILLLGDNRDRSKDSRFWEDPFLPVSRVKGRALIVYWSWDTFKRIGHIIK